MLQTLVSWQTRLRGNNHLFIIETIVHCNALQCSSLVINTTLWDFLYSIFFDTLCGNKFIILFHWFVLFWKVFLGFLLVQTCKWSRQNVWNAFQHDANVTHYNHKEQLQNAPVKRNKCQQKTNILTKAVFNEELLYCIVLHHTGSFFLSLSLSFLDNVSIQLTSFSVFFSFFFLLCSVLSVYWHTQWKPHWFTCLTLIWHLTCTSEPKPWGQISVSRENWKSIMFPFHAYTNNSGRYCAWFPKT